MQKLTMPFVKQMMLCGYKNSNYRKHWGYDHYGVDISTYQGGAGSNHNIYAGGSGKVVTCGWDNSGGNVVVVIYTDVYNHSTDMSCDLVARYMHMASIAVKAGQAVQAGTILGAEGKTQTGDYHLHIEFDTDTKWPLHSPQVSSADDKKTTAQGNILLHGPVDSSVNPSYIFHIGAGQEIVKPTYNPAWLNDCDFNIPPLKAAEDTAEIVAALRGENALLRTQLAETDALRRTAVQNLTDMAAKIAADIKLYTA